MSVTITSNQRNIGYQCVNLQPVQYDRQVYQLSSNIPCSHKTFPSGLRPSSLPRPIPSLSPAYQVSEFSTSDKILILGSITSRGSAEFVDNLPHKLAHGLCTPPPPPPPKKKKKKKKKKSIYRFTYAHN